MVITDFKEVQCPLVSLSSREFVGSILVLEILILYTEQQLNQSNWFFPCVVPETHPFFHSA